MGELSGVVATSTNMSFRICFASRNDEFIKLILRDSLVRQLPPRRDHTVVRTDG